jgi:hypothetical protein
VRAKIRVPIPVEFRCEVKWLVLWLPDLWNQTQLMLDIGGRKVMERGDAHLAV